jgi:hypothetical protein
MLHVFERLFLLCPYASARAHLAQAIDEVAKGLPQVGAAVKFEQGSDPLRSDEPWHVSWIAQAGTLQPDFRGSLAVRLDSSYRGAVLEIMGDCVPPENPGFDMEAAGMLAAITARVLLTQIGSALERRYNDAVFFA